MPDDRAQSLSKEDKGGPAPEGHIKNICAKQRNFSSLFPAKKPFVNNLQKQAEWHFYPIPGSRRGVPSL